MDLPVALLESHRHPQDPARANRSRPSPSEYATLHPSGETRIRPPKLPFTRRTQVAFPLACVSS